MELDFSGQLERDKSLFSGQDRSLVNLISVARDVSKGELHRLYCSLLLDKLLSCFIEVWEHFFIDLVKALDDTLA